jgi:hypothetical protein
MAPHTYGLINLITNYHVPWADGYGCDCMGCLGLTTHTQLCENHGPVRRSSTVPYWGLVITAFHTLRMPNSCPVSGVLGFARFLKGFHYVLLGLTTYRHMWHVTGQVSTRLGVTLSLGIALLGICQVSLRFAMFYYYTVPYVFGGLLPNYCPVWKGIRCY